MLLRVAQCCCARFMLTTVRRSQLAAPRNCVIFIARTGLVRRNDREPRMQIATERLLLAAFEFIGKERLFESLRDSSRLKASLADHQLRIKYD